MSANSSDNHHVHLSKIRHKSDVVHHVLKHTEGKNNQKKQRQWAMIIWLPLWVAVSFVAAQLITALLLAVLNSAHISVATIMSNAVFETVVACIIYIVTLVITIGMPYWVKKSRTSLKVLGFDNLMTWTDIGLSPLGFIAYALLWSFASYVVVHLIPSFPIDQAQEVEFKTLSRQYEYTLAFLTLVVIAPLAEETLFRGYLYGKLQKYIPMIPALIATSLLFGMAHLFAVSQLQWNVALDTFCLSVVLCSLRSITGTIWAGVLLHMIKNGIAFFYVFGGMMLMMG